MFDHNFGFDPSHGLGLDALLALVPPPAPPGFDAFWRARYAKALGVDPRPHLSAPEPAHPNWRVQDITYTSTDGFPISGWLLTPRRSAVKRALIVGHGYGGRDGPDWDFPTAETAILFPCFRGLSLSNRPPISGQSQWHVLHGINNKDNYILGGCVEDLWVGISALLALFPETEGKIGYSGISFGGGIGALAIPYDPRIDRGHLIVPTFGNMPLWLTLPSTGSAASVQIFRKRHPDVLNTLRYFDAATAATRIDIPMLTAVARFDPAVAPPCQFTIANALTTSKHHETVILSAGHFDYPGQAEEQARLRSKVRQFFRAE